MLASIGQLFSLEFQFLWKEMCTLVKANVCAVKDTRINIQPTSMYYIQNIT